MAATILSWETGHASSTGRHYAEIAVLIVAFVKVRIVLMEFIEVRSAPVILKVLAQAWAIGVCAVLIAIYGRPWW